MTVSPSRTKARSASSCGRFVALPLLVCTAQLVNFAQQLFDNQLTLPLPLERGPRSPTQCGSMEAGKRMCRSESPE